MTIETQTFVGRLAVVQCCNCHIFFGIPKDMNDRLIGTGGVFCCPAGHRQAYVESELDRLKKSVMRQEATIDQLKASVASERQRVHAAIEREQHQRRRVKAQKAAKTRLKNRVANGVCICCNRFFKNLASHMKTQHPEVTDKPDEADKLSE